MPLHQYGVLKGHPVGGVPKFEPNSPHYQIHIAAAGVDYRIAVNVKSNSDTNSELQYLINTDFHHPITAQLLALKDGFTSIKREPGGIALDYIRWNLFDMSQMRVLPFNVPGPNNDLNELVDDQVQRSIQDKTALMYVFGERWGPEKDTPDKVFKFKPGNGVHDIHMNQGNDSAHASDDGVWQDGGLLIHYPSANRWAAVFLKFQSQSTHTQEGTGHRIDTPAPVPAPVEPEKIVCIVAAMINPAGGEPETETVTLLNASPKAVDLTGWTILDRMKHKQKLTGTIRSGDTLKVTLSKEVQLGNKGGAITLLNAQGLKVDGVAYTQEQASHGGWTVVF